MGKCVFDINREYKLIMVNQLRATNHLIRVSGDSISRGFNLFVSLFIVINI